MKQAFDTSALLLCRDLRERERLLAEIFMRHRARLRRMVQLRLHPRLQGRVDPSDVLQEAYLEAWRRLKEFLRKRPMPLFLWLRRITGQRLVDQTRFHLRSKLRSVRHEVRLSAEDLPEASSLSVAAELVERAAGPSERAMEAETRLQVLAALERMDPVDREILVLRHLEDLTNAEAARSLGIGESASSKRYFRALKRLKGVLSRGPRER
jgi:RNA polymerase sigma-70 factor (ECF subfamily)